LRHSWGREGRIIHETPIRVAGLAARVHRLRSGRLRGGCRASSRRSRCPSAVRLDRSRLLRERVLPRLSRAWVLRASSPSLAVVAARSVGRSSHGGARSPGRRRFFPINPSSNVPLGRATAPWWMIERRKMRIRAKKHRSRVWGLDATRGSFATSYDPMPVPLPPTMIARKVVTHQGVDLSV